LIEIADKFMQLHFIDVGHRVPFCPQAVNKWTIGEPVLTMQAVA
jgi:hypothetical protein